ncbi:MAG: hypothetical protein U5K79_10020 [Cyclobacteriaceae bacterium]|nr:hypothetical protein [Cyclobacteriaceae bacterium]
MLARLIVVISCFILLPCIAFSQAFNPYQHAYQGWNGDKIKKASPFRAFLNKFSLTVGAGYGRTFYNHQVTSDVLETPDGLVILDQYSFSSDSIQFSGVINWLNAPTIYDGNETYGPTSPNRVLYADSAEIRYGGSGYNVAGTCYTALRHPAIQNWGWNSLRATWNQRAYSACSGAVYIYPEF